MKKLRVSPPGIPGRPDPYLSLCLVLRADGLRPAWATEAGSQTFQAPMNPFTHTRASRRT